MDEGGVSLICSLLGPNTSVLEYGAGGSTTFFSQFVHSWVSIEHNPAWAREVDRTLANLPWGDRVKVYTVLPDTEFREGRSDGTEEQFHSYLHYPGTLGMTYDLVINDGRARVGVSRALIQDNILASRDSRVVVHDWDRLPYGAMVTQV